MKIFTLVAAAAVAVLAVPAASASAVVQPGAVSAAAFAAGASLTVQERRHWDRDHRRYDRRHRRTYWRTVCARKWRNGSRVRVCRKIRYYR